MKTDLSEIIKKIISEISDWAVTGKKTGKIMFEINTSQGGVGSVKVIKEETL